MAELLVILARICLMVAIILNFVTMLKDFSRSQAVVYAVRVIIYQKRCKLLLHTTCSISHTHSTHTHTHPSESVPKEERTSGLYGARED